MKKIFFIFFLIIFSVNCLAIRDLPIFSGEVISGEPFFINGEEYSAVFIRYVNNTVIYYPNGINDVLTQNKSCSGEWIYGACIKDIKYTIKGKVVPENVREANINISFRLSINTTNASVLFSHKYDSVNFLEKEKILSTILLINEGKINALNLTLVIEYPGYFEITDAKGCVADLNSVMLNNVFLNENKSLECTYLISSKKPAQVNVTSELTYVIIEREVKKSITTFLNISPLQKEDISVNNSENSSTLLPEIKPEDKIITSKSDTIKKQVTSPIKTQETPTSNNSDLKISPLFFVVLILILVIALIFIKLKHNKYNDLDKEIAEIKKKE